LLNWLWTDLYNQFGILKFSKRTLKHPVLFILIKKNIMALEARLKLDGVHQKLDVLEFDYEFTQQFDLSKTNPVENPKMCIINVIFRTTCDKELYDWMFSKDKVKNGTIDFKINIDASFIEQHIHFNKGYCVRLHEYFNSNNEIQMNTKISIIAKEVIFGDNNSPCRFPAPK